MNISESCFLDVPSPTYDRYLFDFEKKFDYWRSYYWFVNNWSLSFHIAGVYLVAIFVGQRLMVSRPPFQLRLPLFLWNLTLALLSLTAAVRILPEVVSILNEFGFYRSLCVTAPTQRKQAGGLWCTLFTILKAVELGDTAFIVLRKTPLIFLHWYHHVSVLLFTWSSSAYPSAMQQHFYVANLIMHAFVYSYYTLKVLRVRIPRRVNIAITLMQILEMLLGVFVTFSAYKEKAMDPDCCVFDQAIRIAVVVYVSYFVLFTNFFIKSYISNKGTLFDEKGAIKKLA